MTKKELKLGKLYKTDKLGFFAIEYIGKDKKEKKDKEEKTNINHFFSKIILYSFKENIVMPIKTIERRNIESIIIRQDVLFLYGTTLYIADKMEFLSRTKLLKGQNILCRL